MNNMRILHQEDLENSVTHDALSELNPRLEDWKKMSFSRTQECEQSMSIRIELSHP